MPEYRVVHDNTVNQSLNVGDREVWFDEEGTSEPLTEAEHARLVTIPGFTCYGAAEGNTAELLHQPLHYRPLEEADHRWLDALGYVAVKKEALEFLKFAETEAAPNKEDSFLSEVVSVFEGEVVNPTPEDLAAKGDESPAEEPSQDLQDAWLDMDEDERCDTVSSLEENGADDTLLVALFDYEANNLNSPDVIAAIDTAILHVRKPTSVEKINAALFKESAAGKVTTKNPPRAKGRGE